MWQGFGRGHEGFADFTDILSRYVKRFRPFLFLHLPPVVVGLLDQHVAFPLPDDNDAVFGLVLIVVVHLDVDLARGNRQFCHGASDRPPGSSPQEEKIYYHGFMSRAVEKRNRALGKYKRYRYCCFIFQVYTVLYISHLTGMSKRDCFELPLLLYSSKHTFNFTV